MGRYPHCPFVITELGFASIKASSTSMGACCLQASWIAKLPLAPCDSKTRDASDGSSLILLITSCHKLFSIRSRTGYVVALAFEDPKMLNMATPLLLYMRLIVLVGCALCEDVVKNARKSTWNDEKASERFDIFLAKTLLQIVAKCTIELTYQASRNVLMSDGLI